MTFKDELLKQKAVLERQLEALNILLTSFNDGQSDEQGQTPQRTAAGTDNGKPGTARGKGGRSAHEGITEGKSGDCTTTFIRADASTEFTASGFDEV